MAPLPDDGPLTRSNLARRLVTERQFARSTYSKGNPKRNDGFRWYWLAWACVSLVAFLVPELYVATHDRMDLTLSDTLRAVLGIDPPSKGKAIGSAAFATVLATGVTILILHITAGWPG